MDMVGSLLLSLFMYIWFGALAVVVIAVGVYTGMQMHVRKEEKKRAKRI
ncbi:hypothetical protein BpOF4_17725 [Alkalihalophilus pseudofirmus OF4]|uniref:DUF3149 domain-containing protein n=1 Tax=Alkalihalophilus pseudofirmus (strain ATCC BAA-2126 / JCM 17055 / OF4) TaxID=398511 RepID=D3FRJ5_ALKPO|nr:MULTISPECIES: hypothetical protein [Alkalihalophilus]ADC51586.1 hypothetical protein BpOF4_17725 [Alkalihalophilus pseudofirmus OF4]MED1603375.1 hypothetical protein [Alkalihalophilus marmarensis]